MLALIVREASAIPVESEYLAPDRLVGMELSQIAQLPLHRGNRLLSMGDFFRLEGSPDDQIVEFQGDCSSLKRIGAGMKSGIVRIRGSAGMHLGAEMIGGEIEVFGNVDQWAGAEMKGGSIRIHGEASDHLGGAYPGSVRGMRGGMICVEGKAGHEVGANMRRGLIAVREGVGDFAGVSMIAGTIFAGALGKHPGAGMKRGTLLSIGPISQMPPTFRFDCEYRPTFLHIYLRHLQRIGFPWQADLSQSRFRRYSGDLLALGKGEILERFE